MNNLKKLMLITFISLTSFACSSDDDSGDPDSTSQNQANIIGTWRFTSSTTNGVADTIDDCELMDTALFTSSQVTFTYFEGVNCADSESETFNYSINGNTLSATIEGETFTSEIITLNSTTLTIQDVDGNDTYTETYTKQ